MRIYFLFSFSLLLVTLTSEAKISTAEEYTRIWSDPPSDNMKKYMIKMAISDGLDKNSIKIETDRWGEVILSDTWRNTIKFRRGSLGEYTTVNKSGIKLTIKEDFSGNIVVKNEDGDRSSSTVLKNIHGNLEIRDEKGNVKTVSKNILGDVNIQDNQGNSSTISKDILGNLEIRDNKGNSTRVRKDILDNLTIENSNGQRTTVRNDILGGKTIEDNSGNRVSVRKDVLGNYDASDNKGNRASVKKDILGKITIDDPKGILNETVRLQLIEELSKN
ncbi:hypothetical protein D3C87_728470 [compost metagenome]